jgi:predicted Zn-dependent protease with MMP-like domain
MDRSHFSQIVAEAFAALPDRFKHRMVNVAVMTADEPSAEVRAIEELADDETLLGYYHGIPATERGAGYGIGDTLPDTITLFRLPIEDEADGNPDRIRTVVAETLWHEIAHHFGMDEGRVRSAERRKHSIG